MLLVEPERISVMGNALILSIQHQVSYPVYINPLRHAGVGLLKTHSLCINHNLSIQHCRRLHLWVEAYFVEFSAIYLRAVYDKIVIKHCAVPGERACKGNVEEVYIVVVEIHLGVHLPCKLRPRVVILQSRYAASLKHLPIYLRILAVVELRI